MFLQLILGEVDGRGKNHRASPAGFGEGGEKIVSRDYRFAVPHSPKEFLERLCSERPPMFLLSKHHRIVKVENDTAVGSLEEAQLEFIETDGLKQDDNVVSGSFF